MTAFFTADPHFEHANILKYCKRPFTQGLTAHQLKIVNALFFGKTSVEVLAEQLNVSTAQLDSELKGAVAIMVSTMREAMIINWNAKVKPGDTVYIIGDFAFSNEAMIASILDRLNGQKFLIYGNHDKSIKGSQVLRSKFVKCCDYLELTIQDATAPRGQQKIVMSHYAMIVWNASHHSSWMLHGHSHGSLKYPFEAKILDVGMDAHNFAPISYDEVKVILDKRPIQAVDHH